MTHVIDGSTDLLGKLTATPEAAVSDLDQKIMDMLPDWVEAADLRSFVQLTEGQREPPRGLHRYRLATIMGEDLTCGSRAIAQYDVQIPDDVVTRSNELVFLDTSMAIGLVYKDNLIALAAAALLELGDPILQIAELQAVIPGGLSIEERRHSGLYGGFYWRDTLVQTWAAFAAEAGIGTISIQGAQNNMWALPAEAGEAIDPNRVAWFKPGYDEIARHMGFTLMDDDNWHLSLKTPKLSQ